LRRSGSFAGGELGAGQSKASTSYGVFVIRCTDYAVAVTYFLCGSESQHGDSHRRVEPQQRICAGLLITFRKDSSGRWRSWSRNSDIVYGTMGIISFRIGL
jgi:hypothetical protein